MNLYKAKSGLFLQNTGGIQCTLQQVLPASFNSVEIAEAVGLLVI